MTILSIRTEIRAVGAYRKLSAIGPNIKSSLDTFLTAFSVRLSDEIQHNIIELFHSTGRLFQSVYAWKREGLIVAGVKDVPYARILEEGGQTRPHVILPRTASILAWEGPAGMVFAKRVNHPGSNFPARPYVSKALADLRGDFDQGIREVVAQATGEL